MIPVTSRHDAASATLNQSTTSYPILQYKLISTLACTLRCANRYLSFKTSTKTYLGRFTSACYVIIKLIFLDVIFAATIWDGCTNYST